MLLPDRNKKSFLEIRFADRNKKRSTPNMKIMKEKVVGFKISSNRVVLLNNPFHPSIDFGVCCVRKLLETNLQSILECMFMCAKEKKVKVESLTG